MSDANEIPAAGQVEAPTATESQKSEGSITINNLPNELLLNIFGYLDSPQPSAVASTLHDEPTFDITHSDVADLKTISNISKRWREAVTPMLFRHARFIIPKTRSKQPSTLDEDIRGFFAFITRNQLHKLVTSFTLICYDDHFEKDNKRDPKNVLSIFWELLFEAMDPVELLVVAPPVALGFFTACLVNDLESWHFDSPCHYLRLGRSTNSIVQNAKAGEPALKNEASVSTSSTSQIATEGLQTSNAGNASSSKTATTSLSTNSVSSNHEALFKRPWTKLLLNEGSFIRAYATYEYWNRAPPSILSSLLGSPSSTAIISPTIRDMEYIGIFPTETHFSTITRHCPRLDRLYVQLVPRNAILEDEAKMKQVHTEDLWMERNRCYALLMRELFNNPPEGNYNFLRIFESGDSADKDAWSMAVEYVKRAGNGWKVAEEGVFVKELPSPPAEDGVQASALSVK